MTLSCKMAEQVTRLISARNNQPDTTRKITLCPLRQSLACDLLSSRLIKEWLERDKTQEDKIVGIIAIVLSINEAKLNDHIVGPLNGLRAMTNESEILAQAKNIIITFWQSKGKNVFNADTAIEDFFNLPPNGRIDAYQFFSSSEPGGAKGHIDNYLDLNRLGPNNIDKIKLGVATTYILLKAAEIISNKP